MSDPQENLGSLKDVYVIQANGKKALAVTGGGQALDVLLQDPTTDSVIVYFNQVHNSTTLSVAAVKNEYTVSVVSAAGIVPGSYFIMFDPASERFSTSFVVSVDTLDITLDSPIDFDYPEDTFVDIAIVDMSVNGSVTPQRFGLRGIGAPPGVDIKFDLTRIIFSCVADSAVDLTTFANIAALTNGLLLRTRNGECKNIFNVKDNREIAGIMFDFIVTAATNPQQGEDGFVGRLTFAGQNKIGVVIRLPIGDDAEIWVQDNLLAITSLRIVAEGHIVED